MIKRNIKEYYEREKEKYFDYFILGISAVYLLITAATFWLSFMLYHNTNIVGIILGFLFLIAYIIYFKIYNISFFFTLF